MKNKIEFPWPPKECSPNNCSHWSKKAKARQKQKLDAHRITKAAKPVVDRSGKNIPLEITFHPPSRRGDLDNMVASAKHIIDGLSAAIFIDDRNFYPLTIIRGDVLKGGLVVIRF